jgi:hypothetical protein
VWRKERREWKKKENEGLNGQTKKKKKASPKKNALF